jgi:hypothetical protein
MLGNDKILELKVAFCAIEHIQQYREPIKRFINKINS